MKRLLLIAAVLFTLAGTAFAQDRLTADQIDEIARTVVYIEAVVDGQVQWTGSGTIIDPSGLIFTNAHVADGANAYLIYTYQDEIEPPVLSYTASLDGTSSQLDFAVLQVTGDGDGNTLDPASLNLPYLAEASAERPRRGDSVFIFGYPGIGDGYLQFTTGVVTGIIPDTINGVRVPVLYQTDAEISPGNSGGLAVNALGQMIGIPTLVSAEETTGGRLGGLLPLEAIYAEFGATIPSEVDPEGVPPTSGTPQPSDFTGGLDYTLDPNYGGVELEEGFSDDPHTVEIVSGATDEDSVDVSSAGIDPSCYGYATTAPDYRVIWSGSADALRFFFAAETEGSDTTLIINDPSGTWFCNDDFESGVYDPLVDIEEPLEGTFDIWVGSYTLGENIPGTLYVTEQNIDPTTVNR